MILFSSVVLSIIHFVLDINECERQTHTCTQGCSNIDGSFDCTCKPGYVLADDGIKCNVGM